MENPISPIDSASRMENVKDLSGLLKSRVKVFKGESGKLGMVAGKVSDADRKKMLGNRNGLITMAHQMRSLKDHFPVFTPADFINQGVEEKLGGMVHEAWLDVLKEKGLITDLYLAPGWRDSTGATEEHDLALEMGLTVYYPSDLEKPLPSFRG